MSPKTRLYRSNYALKGFNMGVLLDFFINNLLRKYHNINFMLLFHCRQTAQLALGLMDYAVRQSR